MNNNLNKTTIKDFVKNQNSYYILNWNDEEHFYCSESFENLIGYTVNEISKLPRKHHSLLKNEESELIHNSILDHDFNEDGNEKIIDIEITTREGKNIWLREFVSKSMNDDNLVSVLFNITDFKDNEFKLNEDIDLKRQLNKSKDKLISIISHDLRAPFSSLLGFSEILLNEPGLPEDEKAEYLKYIYDASKVQLQMVNHLLDWTRLQAGTMKFETRRLDIKDMVDNCVSVLTGSIIRKNIECKVEGENGIYVLADERLLNQVITNLLSNAVKFTPPGKNITITIDLYKDDMIEVIIADEGVGIDENHHDKLFRIDAKYSKTGTAGEKGSGFGLTLVKEIVEKHGGNIWFYSTLNQGSEFHFTLPKAEDSILIVEEHDDLRREYESLFNKQFPNYDLKFTKNGFDALNFILQKTPSLLITYHHLPLMNGVQLVTSLRERDIHKKTKIIILAEEISEKDKNVYWELGVNDIVKVETDFPEMKSIIEKLISY